ncbi:hypothetical protein [Candidatus Poriferisocius sp.]|uniref:hypothetical protein n=1 Tax=Candidatus Poriferisocius sp. TaxID=3101276 RepID=UPI003B02C843
MKLIRQTTQRINDWFLADYKRYVALSVAVVIALGVGWYLIVAYALTANQA